ncbi:MAG TPA: MarR family transcriptional regulator [Pseudonocardia sp.]|nr:MarR family transcriptional regulator [Pseudonocardia sp.]
MDDDLGGLTESEGRAWGALLRAHARCVRQMDAELESAHGTALTTYDVLRQLALAPGARLRMAELAERVMLSRPGLTGVVKRLEAAGLLTREPVPEDGRGSAAVLTPAGRRHLAEAHPTHVRSIRERFAGRFSDDELSTLAELLGRIG